MKLLFYPCCVFHDEPVFLFTTMACPESKEPTTNNCEAGKHPDDEEDNGVSLVDVLEEEAQLEEDANAVLGGSDDANCTYNLVYTATSDKLTPY